MGIEEINDEELRELQLEERHDAMMKSLKDLAISIKEQPDMTTLLEKNLEAVKQFTKKLSELETKKEVKVIANHDPVIKSINQMAEAINNNLALLIASNKKEWKVDVKRNNFGFIESATIK